MSVPGSIPALTLFLSQTGAAAVEPAPAVPEAAASAPLADTPAPPREPEHKGTGLLATTGILGGTSLSLVIARNVLLAKNCPIDGSAAASCTYDWKSDIGLSASAMVVNFGMVGVAPAAGWNLGRYHAWKDASGSGKQRKIGAIMGAGGGLLGVGIGGVVTTMALAVVLPIKCADKELESGDALEGDRCLLRAFPGWTVSNWASYAMIASGAAMLAYGKAYKRHRPTRVSMLQIVPAASRTYAGLGLTGRF